MTENVDALTVKPITLESPKPKIIRDTVNLPLAEREFIHVETTPDKLSYSFGKFAEQFGANADAAQKFFEDNVHFKFGVANDVPVFDTQFDNIWAKLVTKLQGSEHLGVVGPESEGKYTVCVDTQRIAQMVPRFSTSKFKIEDYARMSIEEKIVSFEQAVETVTEHEFFHILQEMKDPIAMKKAVKLIKSSYRLFLAFTSTAVMAFIPPIHEAAIPAALSIVGASVYLNRHAINQIEPDAYDVQRKARSLNLKSPFNFIHETTLT